MGRKTKDQRLKVLRLYEKGVSISDCARLAGVVYETARPYLRTGYCLTWYHMPTWGGAQGNTIRTSISAT